MRQEGDEVDELLLVQLLAVVLRHELVGEALRHLLVGIDDRRVDLLGRLPLEGVVEVRPDVRFGLGRAVRVATPARRLRGLGEDLAAGLGVPSCEVGQRLLGNGAGYVLREGRDGLLAAASRDESKGEGDQRERE